MVSSVFSENEKHGFDAQERASPESRRARAEEDMIRRGRREEKTETKRDRKSIIAENRATHETLQKQWFQTVISHASAGTSKTVNFGKAATKFWLLGAETEYTTFLVVSSVFFFRK